MNAENALLEDEEDGSGSRKPKREEKEEWIIKREGKWQLVVEVQVEANMCNILCF